MVNIMWIKSEKGHDVLTVSGFVFRIKNKIPAGKSYWTCKTSTCSVTAITQNRNLISLSGVHAHSNDEEFVVGSVLRGYIREMISNNPYRPAQDLYDCAKTDLVQSYNQEIARLIPSFDTLKVSIYRWKKEVAPMGIILDSTSFNIDFFRLSDNVDMLLYASFGPDSLVVLGDYTFIQRFTNVRTFNVVMDGTFKSSSTSFFQVYIIHGVFSGQSFPLLYCFMSRKTQVAYVRMLTVVKEKLSEKNIDFVPRRIQIDFEQAAFNAIRVVFPEAEIRGCYFHFGQAIWRRVQSLGLTELYHEDSSFRHCVQLCSALPLIPLEKIDEAWDYILQCWTTDNPSVTALKRYIEENWLLRSDGSLFSRETWNHFGDLRGRTNNSAEGFHVKLNKKINKSTASFWEVGYILKQIQIHSNIELRRLVGGGRPKSRKRIYVQQNERIKRLWDLYENRALTTFELLEELKDSIKLVV